MISLKVLFELFDLCFILSCVGASVAVKCKVGKSVPSFNKEVKTNENGEFKVQLPFKVWKQVKRIKGWISTSFLLVCMLFVLNDQLSAWVANVA